MKIFKKALALSITLSLSAFAADSYLTHVERIYQEDADLVRLNDLAYWSGLIEAYHQKMGHYPLQNTLADGAIGLVRIATREQQPQSVVLFQNNGRFDEKPMKALVDTLSQGLGKPIEERYDIQKVATNSPIGYFYFIEKDGYAIWTTCITCGVTSISTLLSNGITPTVNITSHGMRDKVFKSLSREEMLAHPRYQEWMLRPFHKKAYVEQLVQQHLHDSQQP